MKSEISSFVDMAGCAPIRVVANIIAITYVPFAAFPVSQFLPSYRGYDTLSIDNACEAVQAGKISICMAAEQYGVPKSTLHAQQSSWESVMYCMFATI